MGRVPHDMYVVGSFGDPLPQTPLRSVCGTFPRKRGTIRLGELR
jgi:hypothetical protein